MSLEASWDVKDARGFEWRKGCKGRGGARGASGARVARVARGARGAGGRKDAWSVRCPKIAQIACYVINLYNQLRFHISWQSDQVVKSLIRLTAMSYE